MPEKNAVQGIAEATRGCVSQAAIHKESPIEEGHLMLDHVHMLISIPPKYAVSRVMGFVKGKSAFNWPGFTESESAISSANIFGSGGISCLVLDGTKR